jgi:hypothetical protein
MSLTAEQLRPLQLLASSHHGANEELLVLGHGFRGQADRGQSAQGRQSRSASDRRLKGAARS